MKTLTDIKRRIVAGARIETVANTHRKDGAKFAGRMRTVTKAQGNGFFAVFDGDPSRFFCPYPKAAGVTIVDADTFRFALPDGYVELRFVEAS